MKKPCVSRIVACNGLAALPLRNEIDQNVMPRDQVAAAVLEHRIHDIDKINQNRIDPGLFFQFAQRGITDSFARFNPSTWQRPFPLFGRCSAADQKDLATAKAHHAHRRDRAQAFNRFRCRTHGRQIAQNVLKTS